MTTRSSWCLSSCCCQWGCVCECECGCECGCVDDNALWSFWPQSVRCFKLIMACFKSSIKRRRREMWRLGAAKCQMSCAVTATWDTDTALWPLAKRRRNILKKKKKKEVWRKIRHKLKLNAASPVSGRNWRQQWLQRRLTHKHIRSSQRHAHSVQK